MGRKAEEGNEKVMCKTAGQNIYHAPFKPQTVVWKLLAEDVFACFHVDFQVDGFTVWCSCWYGSDLAHKKGNHGSDRQRGIEAKHRIVRHDGQEWDSYLPLCPQNELISESKACWGPSLIKTEGWQYWSCYTNTLVQHGMDDTLKTKTNKQLCLKVFKKWITNANLLQNAGQELWK